MMHAFLYKQHFFILSNTTLKFVKNLADAKQHPQAEKRENSQKWPKMAILCL